MLRFAQASWLVLLTVGCTGPGPLSSQEESAAANLRAAGASVTTERVADALAVTRVYLRGVEQTPVGPQGQAIQDRHLALLENFPKLERLTVHNADITERGLATLSKLPCLKSLSLARSPATDVNMESIAGLESLEELDLSGTKVGDAGLQHLKPLQALQYLTLNETAVTNQGLGHLANLKKLKRLTLLDTAVTDKGVAELQAQRPQLEIVYQSQ